MSGYRLDEGRSWHVSASAPEETANEEDGETRAPSGSGFLPWQ